MENRKKQLRNIFSVLLVSFSVGLYAQDGFSFKRSVLDKTAISLDYNYIGRNTLAVGIDYNAGRQDKSITIGAFGRYFRGKDSKDHFIPELKVGYYDGGGYAGLVVSTKHFSPIVGFSFLKFMNVYGGYSIPFDSEKNLNGFSIGVSINIGLTQISKYYDNFTFKLM